MDADTASLFCSAYTKGNTLHETVVLARLSNGSVPITDTITRVLKFENQKEPPTLSDQGMFGKKSDIPQYMQIPNLSPTNDQTMQILDGAAILHMVRPTKARNFQEYATPHVVPYVESSVFGTPITRLHIIWDTYPENNLKMQMQERHQLPVEQSLKEYLQFQATGTNS